MWWFYMYENYGQQTIWSNLYYMHMDFFVAAHLEDDYQSQFHLFVQK